MLFFAECCRCMYVLWCFIKSYFLELCLWEAECGWAVMFWSRGVWYESMRNGPLHGTAHIKLALASALKPFMHGGIIRLLMENWEEPVDTKTMRSWGFKESGVRGIQVSQDPVMQRCASVSFPSEPLSVLMQYTWYPTCLKSTHRGLDGLSLNAVYC